MKRSITIILLAAATLWSCNDLLEIPSPEEAGKGGSTPSEVPEDKPVTGDVVFTGILADLADGSHPTWEGNDQILLWDGTKTQTLTNSAEAGPVGRFPGKIEKGGETFVSVSPAVEGIQFEGQTVSCVLPVTQSAGTVLPWIRVAKSGGTTLSFLPVTSRVNFSIGFEGATKVVIKTSGEKIAGKVSVDYSEDTPYVTATSDQIEIAGEFVKNQNYSFTVVPGTIASYTVVVYSGETARAHITGGSVEMLPGLTATLPEFPEDQPTFKIAHMWVWGGTGPEYDCTKIYDMLAKPGCFNDEDGRGITALQDNYYILGTDGSFTNFAGEAAALQGFLVPQRLYSLWTYHYFQGRRWQCHQQRFPGGARRIHHARNLARAETHAGEAGTDVRHFRRQRQLELPLAGLRRIRLPSPRTVH